MAHWTTNFSPKFRIGWRSKIMALHQRKKRCPRTMKSLWKFYNPQPDSRMVITKLAYCGKRTQNCRITDGLLRQLKQLKATLSTKPVLREKYEENLQKDLHNGYVIKNNTCTDNTKSVSYVSHHPVSNENKPGKLWRVTNASSIFQGQSLNSNLLKVLDLLSNLVGIILRFREIHIAISADIVQIFMQVKVVPSNHSYHRFLWDHNGKIEEYEYTSHIFGATSSPCIASYALRCSAKDKQKQFPEASHIVERNIYMDDFYIRWKGCKHNEQH